MEKSAFSKIGQPLSDDDRLDIKAWMEKRQRHVDTQGQPPPTPIRRGEKAILSDEEYAAIVFNETRSLSGSDVAGARQQIAHALMNADETWGPKRGVYARTAASVAMPPEVEQDTYRAAVEAVAEAKRQRSSGSDPTGGAVFFRFTTEPTKEAFNDAPLRSQTQLHNSFTRGDVPSSTAYLGIYGGDRR
jgi:hypothetical protein